MIPYFGILVDSFWEAVGNKVLWALLLGWSIILLALAPFGYISQRSFQLTSTDIDNRSALTQKLVKGAKGQGSKSVRAVVSKLDSGFVEKLKKRDQDQPEEARIRASELARELNVAVNAPGLYDSEAFPGAKRRSRLEPLIATPAEELEPADLEQLNRELLQLAFPLELNRPRGEQLWIGYAGFKIGQPLPISRRQINQFIEPLFLGIVIKLGLGILAVFIAIIVTSPMIPDTFKSGSLHLLLSKPISRIWLYLSKFFGGCTFVLLNITYVLFGLYLIAGFRFEIWNEGLLACIPLLLFVFVIFYSVSGLAGLVWGNAIVCVVTCLIFWFCCFSIGFIHDIMLPRVEVLPQISRIRPIDDYLTVVNEKGDFNVWNSQFSVWQPGIRDELEGQARTFGPLYDESRQQIVVKSFFRVPFGSLIGRSRKLSLISVDEVLDGAEQPSSASEARETPLWMSDPGPDLPPQVFGMLELDDRMLAVCRGGIYRLDLEKLELIEASERALMGFKIPWISQSAFEKISPQDYFLSENSYAAATASEDGLVVYSSGTLDHLRLVSESLELAESTKLDGDGTEAAIVQMNDAYCVVARDGLPIEILDSTLQPIASVPLVGEMQVKQLAWVPQSDLLAIVTHTGELFQLNCQTQRLERLDLPVRGKVTSCAWQDGSQVYLGIKPDRVFLVDIPANEVVKQWIPASSTTELIYHWAIDPLYKVMPKPAALDNAMTYLLSGSETQTMNIVTNDLEAAQLELDIWTPIISNLAFVAVMLGVSCYYVTRKEY